MTTELTNLAEWRSALPALTGRLTALREPTSHDVGPLVDLLSIADAARFGIEEPIGEFAVRRFIDRLLRDRQVGIAFAYAVTLASTNTIVGLVQVRQLDPAFEGAEWEWTLVPSARGTGVFLEAARMAASFTFASVGAHRLETRVPVQNGRANGALRKLGAVQEGVLRRSMRRGTEYVDQVLWSMLKEEWSDQAVTIAPRVH